MSHSKHSNEELRSMIKTGGAKRNAALEQLIRKEREQSSLKRYFTGRGMRVEDFEDIFFSALEDLVISVQTDRFKVGGDIGGYLFGTCKNKWLSQIKKDKRASQGEHISRHYTNRHSESAVDSLILNEEWEQAWARFNQLGELCKTILKLAFFEKMTNDEIAKIVEYKDERVVRVKKSKCLKALWALSTGEE